MAGKPNATEFDRAAAIKLAVAAACLLGACAMTAYSLGAFDAGPPATATSTPAEETAGPRNQQVAAPNQQSTPGSGASRGTGWRTSSGQLERRD